MRYRPTSVIALAVLFMMALPLQKGIAQDRSATEQAIADSDAAALRHALANDPAAIRTDTHNPPIMQAIKVLGRATPEAKERAREIIRILVSAGTRLDGPFQSVLAGSIGAPVTWISRIAGEREFVIELTMQAPAEQRCAIVADLANDSNNGQWENALASLATIPVRERLSPECQDLFRMAGRLVETDRIPERVETLFAAGMSPTPGDAARLLTYLPVTPEGRRTAARILRSIDLDAPLPDDFLYGTGYRPGSLFAHLLRTSLERPGPNLQLNLTAMPEWYEVLSRKEGSPGACNDGVVSVVSGSWTNEQVLDPSQPIPDDRNKALRAGTGWLIQHCDAALFDNFTKWKYVVQAGSGDLVIKAMNRRVELSDHEGVLSAAFCRGDETLATRLMEGRAVSAYLPRFFACLKPFELKESGEGEMRMLAWMLDHEANPNEPVDGLLPVRIATLLDRYDIRRSLEAAGGKAGPAASDLERFWLARRLQAIVSFWQSPLSFGATTDDYSHSVNLTRMDLQAGGEPSYVVVDPDCSSADCGFAVLHKEGREWSVVLNGWGDFEALPDRHHGLADLRVSARMAAARYDTTVYRFDGHRYRAHKCEVAEYDGNDSDPTVRPVACSGEVTDQ